MADDELAPIRLFRDQGGWKAYMREFLAEVGMHGPGTIADVVVGCRAAARQYSSAGTLTVRVSPGTELSRRFVSDACWREVVGRDVGTFAELRRTFH